MPYNKPWISYEEQLEKLTQRGLTVTDDEKALAYLKRIGYYRLSGYWFPFRERSGEYCPLDSPKKGRTDRLALDQFKQGATFQQAVDLYVFDKRLRLLVMDALERIEIALRVDISHFLGEKDSFAYQEGGLFFEKFTSNVNPRTGLTKHADWLRRHAKLINRSKEEFIQHNKNQYGLPLPIWIACEVWDFGTMSTLYSGMKPEDQDAISLKYGVHNGRHFASWLRSLNYLRNVCAHHSRLWNRNIIDQPKLTPKGQISMIEQFRGNEHALARPFFLLCIVQHLMAIINPTSSWWERLKTHMLEFPDLEKLGLNLHGMGVVDGWEEWNW